MRRPLVNAILAGVIVVYLAIMLPLTNHAEENDTFGAVQIDIVDTEGRGFITADEIYSALDRHFGDMNAVRRGDFNTLTCQEILGEINRVERVKCLILNDGTLRITVDPIDPVARVFEPSGSVYVNAEGKRVDALAAYHVDVPVVTLTHRADSATVGYLMPLLRAVKTNANANAIVSTIRIDSRGDIIIIPNIIGHVINFGDTTLIDNKFARLQTFYRDVMPVRGWSAYDTVSVKWRGQIVATRRDKAVPIERPVIDIDDSYLDVVDEETMMAGGAINTAVE